jgi:hypothetical protein
MACGTHDCFLHNEFFVSCYENHLMKEDKLMKKLPMQSLKLEAMDYYWRIRGRNWHFFPVPVLDKVKVYDGGAKVLQRVISTKNNLPFMN